MSASPAEAPARLSRLWHPWPIDREVSRTELARLAGMGYRGIQIPQTLTMTAAEAASAARVIWLLREAAACALGVWWRCQGPVPAADLLGHLSPPVAADTGRPVWRQAGRLIERHGPGFVVIEDRRSSPWRRTVLHDQSSMRALGAAARPSDRPARGDDRAALNRLARQGLVLEIGGTVISLPVHPARKAPGTFGA